MENNWENKIKDFTEKLNQVSIEISKNMKDFNKSILKRKSTQLKFKKIRDVRSPERGTPRSAGIDFFIPRDLKALNLPSINYYSHVIDEDIQLQVPPRGDILIPSGIKVEIPKGFALIAFNKSGICTRKNLQVGACVVDEDYQGEVHIHLLNNSDKTVKLDNHKSLVQFVLVPMVYIDILEDDNIHQQETIRGEGGFGSTDKN